MISRADGVEGRSSTQVVAVQSGACGVEPGKRADRQVEAPTRQAGKVQKSPAGLLSGQVGSPTKGRAVLYRLNGQMHGQGLSWAALRVL